MAKVKTLAKSNPRYSYRTPKEEKDQVEKQIKALVEKINSQECGEYYRIDQNTVFLEAVYRGLEYLESAELTPEHDEGYFQIQFIERKRKCSSCKKIAVAPYKTVYKCGECDARYDHKEFKDLKIPK